MSLIRPLSGRKPAISLPKGAIDTQMHAYLPGYPALPGGPGLPAGDLPTPEQYRQFMNWIGIERVIVTQGMAHQLDNANLVACLEAFGDIAWGIAAVDASTSEAELDRLSAARIRGARIMNLPGGAANLTKLEVVDAIAASRDWMIAIQFDGSEILDYEDRLSKLRSRWVLDHHGKFFCGITPDSPQVQATKRLIDGGRCWFKFAGAYESSKTGGPDFDDVAAVARDIAAHAPERIVWGSNWPHNLRAHRPTIRTMRPLPTPCSAGSPTRRPASRARGQSDRTFRHRAFRRPIAGLQSAGTGGFGGSIKEEEDQ